MGKTKKQISRREALGIPKGVRMKIHDVKINRDKGYAVVSVQVSKGKETWFKGLKIETEKPVLFDELRSKVEEIVARDFEIDTNLSDILKRKNRSFVLFKQ